MFNVRDLMTATGGVLGSTGVVPKQFKGVSTDTRTLEEGSVFIALEGKNFDGHKFIAEAVKKGARAVVYSNPASVPARPDKGIAYIKVKDTLTALGDIARFHRERFDIPVVAITGSSGKTTTKEMVSWVLSGKFHVLKNTGTQNNLVGVPLTLLKIHSKHDICVVEMGTNRVGEIERLTKIARPNVGIITNIGPAHLEFLGNLKGVYREKIALIKHLEPPGIVIVNRSDMILGKLARIKAQPVFCFGVNRDAEFMATEIAYQPRGISFTYNKTHSFEIKHGALHNVSNALVAIGCGLLFGMEPSVLRERLGTFEAPDMRLKEVNCSRCVVFDDSYNSNPQSLKHAIDLLCRQTHAPRRVLIMGDMMELGAKSEEFHSYFGHYVSKKPVDILITLGSFSRATSKKARACGMAEGSVHHFDECGQVLEFLGQLLKEGDVLLVKGSRSMRMERIVAYLKERG